MSLRKKRLIFWAFFCLLQELLVEKIMGMGLENSFIPCACLIAFSLYIEKLIDKEIGRTLLLRWKFYQTMGFYRKINLCPKTPTVKKRKRLGESEPF